MDEKKANFESLITELDNLFEKAIKQKIFPGGAIGIAVGKPEKRRKIIRTFGNISYDLLSKEIDENVFFDLASLTKPLATSLAILALLKEKKVYLKEQLPSLLEETIAQEKSNITLSQLLNHSAGFPAYQPYFEELAKIPFEKRESELKKRVLGEKLIKKPGEKTLYSDLGFMILGWIVEKKTGKRLNTFVEEKILQPLDLNEEVFFGPINEGGKEKIFAATEECSWRKKTLSGEVSDDNTYIVGGVSGQAGLFGNIKGVLEITTHLLDQWRGRENHPAYNTEDLRRFLTRQNDEKESTWALGFDTPSEKRSSSGKYLSKESVGHLGFTGTSFWIDPARDLVIVLLTNRVHPSRENNKIKEFRPLFHNTVIEKLNLV